MKVLVTGSSGLVGTSLTAALQQESHNVLKAVRRPPTRSDEVFWNPDEGHIDQTQLHGVDAVVHLAGENIGRKRWTRRHKQTILQSRVTGTRLIVEAIANLNLPPAVLVSASAIGFYGDRGSETLTEDSGSGIGFRAEVCREWEAATSSAEAAGIRVVKLRSGLVLSTDGGILPYLLRPASLGLSFRVGSGTQYWSWISIEDEVRAILFALEKTDVVGPINLTSPNPVRQSDFAAALCSVMKRGRVVPVPAPLISAVLGTERAQEVVLSSQRIFPKRLLDTGFKFSEEHLTDAFKTL